MNDPKNRPLVYLIAGIIAVVAALYFMTLDTSIFDWFILGMGIVAIIKGVREYWQLHGGLSGGPKKPGASGTDTKAPDGKA